MISWFCSSRVTEKKHLRAGSSSCTSWVLISASAKTGGAEASKTDSSVHQYGKAKTLAIAVADQCAASAATAAIGLLQAAGFDVARLDDVPGLAVMRTVAMLANEAADAVNQGVCSAAGADDAMRLGVNYPRGPLAWADAVGLDRIVAVLRHLGAWYGEDRYRISPLLQRRLAAGRKLHD